MIAKTEAIVLKTFDFRETSRIATFFSRDFGKVKGVLKGIRKDSRKFGSSLAKFSVNDIVYYQYRNSEIHLVSHCDMKEYFFALRQDLKKMTAASYVLELVDAIMPVEEPNDAVYELMLDFYKGLQTVSDVSKLIYIFQIKALLYSGFRPHLDSCVQCQNPVARRARFSLKLGGLVCAHCQPKMHESTPISPGAIATLLHVEKSLWPQCLRLGMTTPIKRELKFILNNFLVYHLERQLKSERFIH